jgi:glycosyltransferase involved in cell wall biosynthesis
MPAVEDPASPGPPSAARPAAGTTDLHVLVVSRWYPAFDNPGRGIFVADQVAALAAAGVDVRVASWETAYLRGTHGARFDGPPARTPRAWLDAVATGRAAWAPAGWGAPGVLVTRLPAMTRVPADGTVDLLAVADRQAETLLSFGLALAAQWRIDVVHAHTGVPDGLAAIELADRLGVPLLVTEHDSTIRSKLAQLPIRDAYRRLVAPGRQLLTVSPSMRVRLAELLDLEPGQIEVVPNVVDPAAFLPAEPVERDSHELLWVGGRSAAKGTDVLLDAFRRLHADDPALRLRLVGQAPSGDRDADLRRHAEDLGIAAAVSFEPPTNRAGVAAAMARATVFVHPSPFETFGLVAAEALASGLPVAATPSGGVEGIVGDDGRCGVIATGHEPEALAAAVRAVLNRRDTFDPELLRSRVRTQLDPAAVAARLIELYLAEVAAMPRPASRGAEVAPLPEARGLGALQAVPPVPLVVGLRRSATARRIAALPRDLAAGLVVVTGSAVRDGRETVALPEGPAWVEIDQDRAYRVALARLGGPRSLGSGLPRLLATVRHPVRAVRRRWLASRRDAMAREAIRAGLLDALRRVATTAERRSRPIVLLPLDADDLALALPQLGDGVAVYPSTLRGLADEWDAAGRPAPVAQG